MIARRIAMALVRGWQIAISPLYPPCCRFTPTCSSYSLQALAKFGVWRGGWLGIRRLCRCHPFCRVAGDDPVPKHWPGWCPPRPSGCQKSL